MSFPEIVDQDEFDAAHQRLGQGDGGHIRARRPDHGVLRTLLPSTRGHAVLAVLAVYDGSFPGKDITTIAHFRDGRTVEQSFDAGS